MVSYRSDPYLWVHLAGLAAVPMLALVCLLLLAAGDPLFPAGVELALLAIVGIGPVLWMQLNKPFYIYALLLVAERPASLTEAQRRLLPWFRSDLSRTLAIAAVVPLYVLLWKLYALSPIASGLTPFAGQSRLFVLLLAAGVFLLVNLFAQVPLSVLRLLLLKDQQLAATPPCAVEQIPQEFTILGWPIRQILPQAWLPENRAIAPPAQPPAPTTADDDLAQILDANAEASSPPVVEATQDTPSEPPGTNPVSLDREDFWDEPEDVTEVLTAEISPVDSAIALDELTESSAAAADLPNPEAIRESPPEVTEGTGAAADQPATDQPGEAETADSEAWINPDWVETAEPSGEIKHVDGTELTEPSNETSTQEPETGTGLIAEPELTEAAVLTEEPQPADLDDLSSTAEAEPGPEWIASDESVDSEHASESDQPWVEAQAADEFSAQEEDWIEAEQSGLEDNWIDQEPLDPNESWVEDAIPEEPTERQDPENPSI